MRLLWGESWIDVPRPHPVPGSAAIEVEATAPIQPVGAAHGRQIERPLRKLASFAVTDGPSATMRKARSKRAESAYTGDYHLVAVLGRRRDASEGGRVLALAPRSPRSAEIMLAPRALVRPAPDDLDVAALERFAGAVAVGLPRLEEGLGQSYLYSATEPPAELVAALDEALEAAAATGPPTARVASFSPPRPAGEDDGEVLRLASPPAGDSPPLAVLGAGDYVRIEVAPALAGAGLRLAALADREPQIAALAAAELGFAEAHTDAFAAVDSLEGRGLVVVATAHDSHAALSAHALRAGHRVICEKPAVVTVTDLDLLARSVEEHPGELEVGFNRRHNPLVERARAELAREPGPTTINATVREVDITDDHWYLWPNQGTRVAGNLCHWIDLALHLIGPDRRATSVSVSPRVSDEPTGLDAERVFTVALDDGSTISLLPTARGDSTRGVQESLEIRRGSLTLNIDDLWRLRGLRAGRPIRHRTAFRDKGHSRMYSDALGRFLRGEPAAYPAADLRRVGEVQLAATKLLLTGRSAGDVAELLAEPAAETGATPSSPPDRAVRA